MFMEQEQGDAGFPVLLSGVLGGKADLSKFQQAVSGADMDSGYGRQIQPHTEQRIISHLKRKLNRRVEKRLASIYEKSDEKSKGKPQIKTETVTVPSSQRSSNLVYEVKSPEKQRDIFQRYNEYGERVAFTPANKRRPLISSRKPHLTPLNVNGDATRADLGTLEPLPDIQSAATEENNGDADVEDNGVFSDLEEGDEVVLADQSPAGLDGAETGILINTSREGSRYSQRSQKAKMNLTFQLEELSDVELQAIDDAEQDEEGVSLAISPVPTPHIVYRPTTRETTQLSLHDKHNRILKGNLDIKCPHDTKTACLYISNTGIDTKWELRYFVTELYPQLKEYSLRHNCELRIYDMHWSINDTPFDNHSYLDNCMQAVQECQHTRAVNFVIYDPCLATTATLTSGRYGPSLLPATIDAEEYEAIFECLQNDYSRVKSHIESLVLEQKELDEERDSDKADQTEEEKSNKRKKAQARRQHSIQLAQSIMAKEKDLELMKPQILTDWYKRDDNVIPAVFRLQRISSKFPDINKTDPKKKGPAVRQWTQQAEKILAVLQKYSKQVCEDECQWKKYEISLLEMEIDAGIKHNAFSPGRICWFAKQFDPINELDEAAKDFVETEESRKVRMVELNEQLRNYREVPKKNRENYGLDWIKEGFAPELLRNHMLYLEKLVDRISSLVKESLLEMFEQEKMAIPTNPYEQTLYTEVIQHVTFCQQRARNFHGRQEMLQKMKEYLRSDSTAPLLVYGKSGMGRKSLMCRAAKESQKWCKQEYPERGSPAVVFRSCGITSQSQNIRLLLQSICTQMAIIYNRDPALVPTGYRGLVNDFSDKVRYATADQPLIIVIDSLDQLSEEHDARKLPWMPKQLPPHVKVIFSCLPDDKFQVLDAARKHWGSEADNFVEVGQLPVEDAAVIFSHWLSQANHTLTDDQYNSIMKVYKECPNPLFLRCAFHEALHWCSYTPPEQYKLAAAVKRVATVAFARLEKDHGEALVRRSLGYITASRKGVTLNELEDLISMDDMVMEELSLQYKLEIRRCPPMLIVRLKQDLRSYVTELAADGLKTIQWSHLQFHEAASERYLLQRDKAPSYHKALADYFSGTYGGQTKKPTPSNEDGVPRYVASQSLSYQLEAEGETGPMTAVYNKRALNELPYHFINANLFDMLKSQCLCNYEWLLAKLCACGIRNIFDDFYLAISIEPKDKDLGILLETFQLSRAVLEKDPQQLGSQLAGRLRSLIMKDVPVTPADPKIYPACHPLMAQISKSSIPTFYPSNTCLTPPGGALADILVGHKAEVTALAITSEGMRAVTASLDDTIKFWDLRSGKVNKSISGVGKDVLQLLVGLDNQLIVTSEMACVRVWDLNTQQCVFTYEDFDDYANIAISQNSKILICYLVGVNAMRTYNLEKKCELLTENRLERPENESSIDKDKTLIVSESTLGDQLLVAYNDSNTAFTQNIKSGEIVYKLACFNESARITAVAVSSEYFAVGYQFKYLKREMPYAVDIFSTAGGAYVRTLRGCDEDHISKLYINSNGSHVLCASTSEHTWSSDLAVWNMETEEHKHLASHAGVAHIAGLVSLQYVLTTNKGENTLKLWNLSGSIIKPAPKMKQSIGVSNLVAMKDHPRYVVASSTDNGPMTVWNVAKGKTSGKAVRIEHGLVEPTDIVVLRNTKAVILADRGITGSASIYQSVYIYDLRTKRFERKVPGVYIIPSQAHEFKLLNDELLMGLSENRNQIYIWNLTTGTIAYRIKPTFQSKLDVTASSLTQEALAHMKKRQHTAKMTPWDQRTETSDQRQKRHDAQLDEELKEMEEKRKEKENGVEQFLMSGDEKIVVASFFSHHLCVFDMDRKDHIQTLENDNSLLHLYVAALTHDGSYLVHTNYDEEEKVSYVTLWDCFEGTVRKRLKNEKDVCAIGISDNAQRILFGKGNCELRIWEPLKKSSLRKIQGYSGMNFQFGMNKIFMLKGGSQGIIYAGDISMWDLDKGTVLAVYTPDTRISAMTVAMQGQLLCFGLKDSLSVVSLRLIDHRHDSTTDQGENIMGEQEWSDSSDED